MLFNRPRALEFMVQHDLDALIASSPVNVSYFSDLDCWIYRTFKEYMFSPQAQDAQLGEYAVFPLDVDSSLILRV